MFTSNCQADLDRQLATCAQAAASAITEAREFQQDIFTVLGRFHYDCTAVQAGITACGCDSLRPVVAELKQHMAKLGQTLDRMQYRFKDMNDAWTDMEKSAHLVTVMLFGRTRAGKSTTMEALTGGAGHTIGTGRQHTTRDIKEYFYPGQDNCGHQPALRIVDTPGIEGFKGEDLTRMAGEYVEKADHILFILTDDKASDGELAEFARIRRQGKDVTVLLNVKSRDEDLDLLLTSPQYVFKADEIEGHRRRIYKRLKAECGMDVTAVLPLHARAAWLARSSEPLPEGVADRELLLKNSGFDQLVKRITCFIQHEALPARQRAPRERMRIHLNRIKEDLVPFGQELKQVQQHLEQIEQTLQRARTESQRRLDHNLNTLKIRYDAAMAAIPGMVDTLIARGGRVSNLNSHWLELLKQHALPDLAEWFCRNTAENFSRILNQKVQTIRLYHGLHSLMPQGDLGHLLDDYHETRNSEGSQRAVRTVTRTAGTLLTGLLGTWAVVNFWNPSGWAAAAAIGASSLAGDAVTRSITSEWRDDTRKKLIQLRNKMIQRLKNRLETNKEALHRECERWGTNALNQPFNLIRREIESIRANTRQITTSAARCIADLERLYRRKGTYEYL